MSRSQRETIDGGQDPPRVPRLSTMAMTQLIAVFLVALVTSELIWIVARPLALIFIAVVIAQALSPAVTFLSRWLPRTGAVIAVYVAIILLAIGFGFFYGPRLVSQTQQIADRGQEFIDRAQQQLNQWNEITGGRLNDAITSRFDQVGSLLVQLPLVVFDSLLDIVLVIFMSLYWLIFMPSLHKFTLERVPYRHREETDEVLAEVGHSIGGYVRGVAIDSVIIGVLTYVGLLVIGVNYPLTLAVLAGLGEIVPVVGPIVVTVPIVLVAFLDSPTTALITLGFWIVVQQFESNILAPFIMGDQTDISPLLVIIAVLIGSAAGGLLGALVAIPLFGALRVLFVHLVKPRA